MTSLLTYSKELKINQDTVFVDPIKRHVSNRQVYLQLSCVITCLQVK